MSDLEREVQQDIYKIIDELKRCKGINLYYDLVAKLYYLNELIILKDLKIKYPNEYWFEFCKRDTEYKKSDFERFVYSNAQKYYDYNYKLAKMSDKLKARYVEESKYYNLKYTPFEKSVDYSCDFLYSFDKDIYNFFVDLFNSPRFIFVEGMDNYAGWALRNNYLVDSYTVIIPSYTISDFFSIIHETMHSYNFKLIKNSSIKEHDRLTTNSLQEAPSFFIERVGMDYLDKVGFDDKDITKLRKVFDRETIYLLGEYKEILQGNYFECEDYLFNESYSYGRVLAYHFYDNYLKNPKETVDNIKKFMVDYKIYEREHMLNNYGLNKSSIINPQKLTKHMDKNLMRL